ncbi:FF domain-containing protein [Mycobacteroides abscessus subsp. abscessus]|uniref:metal-dependent hydrolase n=1 Tax=Mycobacteroides abscessus TaxID=36809 RepID=UPI000928836D|nr:metal-dependent hydrolase [Mycobacteroides abscessus]SIL80576.1 FF domain-containing protein [Mycobacteroides abscessus subsp. abscessus]SLF08376.1 FF domain-containing protein [Mycobacteroides abscessus subsp. abscessus]
MSDAKDNDEIGQLALRPRDVKFDWTDSGVYLLPGEPYASHWTSAMHHFFAAGEPIMADAVRRAGEQITDPDLREAAFAFAAQEMTHARSHDSAQWGVLDAHGIDPRPLTRQADYAAELFERIVGSTVGAAGHRLLVLTLAACGGLEMFATAIGNWFLNTDLERFGPDPAMLDLWRWHSAEEVEHRHVVFSVGRYLGIGYLTRTVVGVGAAIGFVALMARGAKFLVHSDPSLPNLGYIGVLREYSRAAKRGALPSGSMLLGVIGRYIRPSHTPEHEGDTAQAVAYLATSPAARSVAL